jgi:phage N-6-adenine-methyltransferase
MNTQFERCEKTTDEWYTPKWIVDALGVFDLDPCAPINRLWDTAKKHLTQQDDGLKADWGGSRIWLNPPYSRPLIERFVKKMVDNNNGIALLFNRCDSQMFQDLIFPAATAVMFLKGRIKFFRPDGNPGGSPGCGSILIAFGDENAKALELSNIPGTFIYLKNRNN